MFISLAGIACGASGIFLGFFFGALAGAVTYAPEGFVWSSTGTRVSAVYTSPMLLVGFVIGLLITGFLYLMISGKINEVLLKSRNIDTNIPIIVGAIFGVLAFVAVIWFLPDILAYLDLSSA